MKNKKLFKDLNAGDWFWIKDKLYLKCLNNTVYHHDTGSFYVEFDQLLEVQPEPLVNIRGGVAAHWIM